MRSTRLNRSEKSFSMQNWWVENEKRNMFVVAGEVSFSLLCRKISYVFEGKFLEFVVFQHLIWVS